MSTFYNTILLWLFLRVSSKQLFETLTNTHATSKLSNRIIANYRTYHQSNFGPYRQNPSMN